MRLLFACTASFVACVNANLWLLSSTGDIQVGFSLIGGPNSQFVFSIVIFA